MFFSERKTLQLLMCVVLRKVFGPRDDEVSEQFGILYNEERLYLYKSAAVVWIVKSRMIRRAVYVARMGVTRNVYRILILKPKQRRRCEDNIQMYLTELGESNKG
jgi:hypothetical protein